MATTRDCRRPPQRPAAEAVAGVGGRGPAAIELMHDLGVVTALAFDRHFEEQGFALP